MKAVGIVALGVCLVQPQARGADASAPSTEAGAPGKQNPQLAAFRNQHGVNLLAFVGRRIEVRYVAPQDGQIHFDAEYFARFEVLQIVFGDYSNKEISFSS